MALVVPAVVGIFEADDVLFDVVSDAAGIDPEECDEVVDGVVVAVDVWAGGFDPIIDAMGFFDIVFLVVVILELEAPLVALLTEAVFPDTAFVTACWVVPVLEFAEDVVDLRLEVPAADGVFVVDDAAGVVEEAGIFPDACDVVVADGVFFVVIICSAFTFATVFLLSV